LNMLLRSLLLNAHISISAYVEAWIASSHSLLAMTESCNGFSEIVY
jgi:hypothetical protein